MNSKGGPLVEGNLALDLINTEEIRRGVRRDFIDSGENFSQWLSNEEFAGAISQIQIPFEVEVWQPVFLEKVRHLRAELRDDIQRISNTPGLSIEFVSRLELFVERAPFKIRLHEGKSIYVPIGEPIERLCSLIAADVFSLIDAGQMKHIRKCENPNCLFMFIDLSGRRKWCSMRRCGNRAKVVNHMKKATNHSNS